MNPDPSLPRDAAAFGEIQIVYGARCVWWDSIDKASTLPGGHGLPCCPYCRSVLMQMDESKWFAGLKSYEADGYPDYEAMWMWSRGRCFKDLDAMRKAFGERDIDTLAEKYLDALNAGEHPDPATFICQLPYELHQEGERRLRFVYLMHRSRPTGGAR